MLYINSKINQLWLHWYKNSYNSLNGYRVMVSIAPDPSVPGARRNSSFITKLGVLINFDKLIGLLFQNFI